MDINNQIECSFKFYILRIKISEVITQKNKPKHKLIFFKTIYSNITFLKRWHIYYMHLERFLQVFHYLHSDVNNKIIIDIRFKFCIYARRAFHLQKTRK